MLLFVYVLYINIFKLALRRNHASVIHFTEHQYNYVSSVQKLILDIFMSIVRDFKCILYSFALRIVVDAQNSRFIRHMHNQLSCLRTAFSSCMCFYPDIFSNATS